MGETCFQAPIGRAFRSGGRQQSSYGRFYKSVFRANCVVARCSQSSCTRAYIPVAVHRTEVVNGGAPSRKTEFLQALTHTILKSAEREPERNVSRRDTGATGALKLRALVNKTHVYSVFIGANLRHHRVAGFNRYARQ